MRLKNSILTAAVAVACMASAAHATITVTTYRTPNPDITGYDSIYVFALNDGTGVDNDPVTGANQNIVSVKMTMTDLTQVGLLPGVYVANADAGTYAGDPDGANQASVNSLASSGNFVSNVPGYNAPGYPAATTGGTAFHPTGASSNVYPFELYSWVGNGGFNTSHWSLAASIPDSSISSTSLVTTGYGTLLSTMLSLIHI